MVTLTLVCVGGFTVTAGSDNHTLLGGVRRTVRKAVVCRERCWRPTHRWQHWLSQRWWAVHRNGQAEGKASPVRRSCTTTKGTKRRGHMPARRNGATTQVCGGTVVPVRSYCTLGMS